MNMFVKGISPETQILIAMGAAVASNCQPCLKKIVTLARENELDATQIEGAVSIGQFVKDQPAQQMKEFADQLIGSNLASKHFSSPCGCQDAESEAHQ